jgi:hypothetical protein
MAFRMTSVSPLREYEPKPIWTDHFATRLGELLPELGAECAYQHALITFEEASDLAPREAAEIFALEMSPEEGCGD